MVQAKYTYNPRATSAQCNTVLLFKNSMTSCSTVAGRSCNITTVATIMSQRSLKTTDMAVLPGRLRAVIGTTATFHPGNCDWPASTERRNLTADKIEGTSVQMGRRALNAETPSPGLRASSANAPPAAPKTSAATTVNANILFIAITGRPIHEPSSWS
jgi:hypothetical protein